MRFTWNHEILISFVAHVHSNAPSLLALCKARESEVGHDLPANEQFSAAC